MKLRLNLVNVQIVEESTVMYVSFFIISSYGKNKIFDCKGVDSYTNGRNGMI